MAKEIKNNNKQSKQPNVIVGSTIITEQKELPSFPTQQETKKENIERLLGYKNTCVFFDKRKSNPPCLVKGCSGDYMEGLAVVFTMKHPSSSSSSSLSYTQACDSNNIGNNVT
jgi:hypothetical protein